MIGEIFWNLDWIDLAWGRDRRRAVVNEVMKPRFFKLCGEFLD